MDLFSELVDAVQSDLTIGDESSLFPPTAVKLALNRAYRKAGALFRWPDTEDAKKTSTIANREYYLMPRGWRPESVYRIEVDSVQYGELPDGSPMDYHDYLNWRNDTANANSTDKKWAVQGRKVFIFPVPTTEGNFNINMWGQETVPALVDDADITIFSYAMPECNDAVVKEALAILKAKGGKLKDGQFISLEAKQILVSTWAAIKKEKAKNEKLQPMLDVPDFFGNSPGRSRTLIGRFDE